MNLEDRIKRRLLVEGYTPELGAVSHKVAFIATAATAARIAALEAEDTANPIAATAIVRKDAVTEITPPDVEALLAAFNRPEED